MATINSATPTLHLLLDVVFIILSFILSFISLPYLLLYLQFLLLLTFMSTFLSYFLRRPPFFFLSSPSTSLQDLQLNRVTILTNSDVGSASFQSPSDKKYDLHPGDKFWKTHRGSPFPEVADAVQSDLAEYKTMEDKMMNLKTVMGMSSEEDPDTLTDNTAKLTSAIRCVSAYIVRGGGGGFT